MILWNIVNREVEYEVEVGPTTIFKGSDPTWFRIVRMIEDFFINKDSEVKIFEDTQPIHRKDWECLLIPFDAHIDLDKLNSKSPLKPIIDSICYDISLTPSYLALTELWEEVNEELDFLHSKVKSYGLGLSLAPFSLNDLRKYISFYPLQKFMTPIEYKQMLIKLFCNQEIVSKKLVILEPPELYASDEHFYELMDVIEDQRKKGIWFMIVTNREIKGNVNHMFQGKIINNAFVEKMKSMIIAEAPIYIDEEIFQEAKCAFLNIVDKSNFYQEKIQLSTDHQYATTIVAFMLMRQIDKSLNVDLSTLPPNLVKFLEEYS